MPATSNEFKSVFTRDMVLANVLESIQSRLPEDVRSPAIELVRNHAHVGLGLSDSSIDLAGMEDEFDKACIAFGDYRYGILPAAYDLTTNRLRAPAYVVASSLLARPIRPTTHKETCRRADTEERSDDFPGHSRRMTAAALQYWTFRTPKYVGRGRQIHRLPSFMDEVLYGVRYSGMLRAAVSSGMFPSPPNVVAKLGVTELPRLGDGYVRKSRL
jgi:hypothetical protein